MIFLEKRNEREDPTWNDDFRGATHCHHVWRAADVMRTCHEHDCEKKVSATVIIESNMGKTGLASPKRSHPEDLFFPASGHDEGSHCNGACDGASVSLLTVDGPVMDGP